jgi:HK97 family phage major capsid protein
MKISRITKILFFLVAAIAVGGIFGSFIAAGIGGIVFATVPGMGTVDYSSAIKEKRETLAGIKAEMRALIDLSETEQRDFSDEEDKKFQDLEKRSEQITKAIERLEKAERDLGGKAGKEKRRQEKESAEERQEKMEAAFRSYLRGGMSALTTEQREFLEEQRALNTGTDAEGGFTVPEGFSNTLEQAMLDFGGIMSVAQILDTNTGNDLPYPTTNDTSNKGAILGENQAAGESVDPAFGSVILKAFTYSSKPVLISNQLLQDNAVNLDSVIAQMLVDRVMRAFAEHAATGGGTSTPQGVTIGGTKGADAAVSSITYDNLVDLQHSVDKNYRKNGTFMFNDNTLKVLRKLKDDQGRPIFQESMRDGEPSTILGKPYVVDNDMPDIGASAKSIAFGDFNKYIVRRVRGYSVKRLTERYADNNQTGFLLFVRLDGRILDAGTHPIKYLQHAAA